MASGWASRRAESPKNLDQLFITAAAYPPEILLTGVVVNKDGKRFVAEDSYHSRTSAFVLEQPDQTAYLIVDEAHMQMPEMPLIKFIDGWETVAEMEAALGIPEGNLAATLDRYNEHAASGEDPDFHKQPEYVAAQDKGPWAAFDLSLGVAMYSGFTMGGLAMSIDGEVLRDDGSVVPGLYAAGACASNIAQDGKGYASGTQLGEGSFFGRRAGAHAARAARPVGSARRHSPPPSSSSRLSWCCSTVPRWLTLTTTQSGSSVRRVRYSANSCPSSSAEVDSSRNTAFGRCQQHPRERDALLLAGREHLGPVGDLVEPVGEVTERDRVQSAIPIAASSNRVRDSRVADTVRRSPSGAYGSCDRNMRRRAVGAAHRARRERPQLREAAQQRGLAGARAAGDDQRVARVPAARRAGRPAVRRPGVRTSTSSSSTEPSVLAATVEMPVAPLPFRWR